ncbi:MAG: class I SAM-dependent methyltransferase [Rhodoplanes sp.]|uniref:class I SAM-dependent methyltransferase n=1 Tax=Rhodoplanes sp. TaxID=1968906 RepID=UPI0017D52493|nr:class I SAM-dependent methyltransferase [Rhodoplanes sp.]NVO14149.1 class I SAM-dependent methyltransferase [Rhodoplanes sp.]
MPDLLIHSMSELSDLILGGLQLAGADHVVEIGAEHGGMSSLLADHTGARGGTLTSIDPAPKPEFRAWAAREPHVRHIEEPSLAVIDTLAGIDAWLIDGDHNWYTVFHELTAIERACRRDGRPLLAFLHDIGWPAGRRDQYYAPERIPAEHRQPFSHEAGAVLDTAALVPGRGFRGMGAFAFAVHEGGPKNGVLTAIEDFLAEALADGRDYAFAEIPAVFGLGIVFALDAPWSARLADLLMPFHRNALLRRLEDNRLRNYLQVIALQDEAAGSDRRLRSVAW